MLLKINTELKNLPMSAWAWLILLISLSTILYSPLMGDDLPMFQYRVENAEVNSKSIHELAQVMVDRFLPMGRLTIISFYYVEWVFRTFTSPIAYKSWMVLLNVLTIAIFLRWLKFIGFQLNTALLLICIATGIQLRLNYHDSYSSYTGLCQLFNSLIFISTASWLSMYRKFNVLMLIAALISTVSLFFISEYALMLLPLIPIVFCFSDQLNKQSTALKRVLTLTIPITLISITYLYVIVFLRSTFPKDNLYSGLSSNIDMGAMIVLELKQIYASLPLSNLTNTPRIPLRIFNQFKFWDVSLLTGVLFFAFYQGRKIVTLNQNSVNFPNPDAAVNRTNPTVNKKSHTLNWLILGAFLLIISPVFILPSSKYQSEMTWGNGYLSLMLQNLGFSLILYGLIDWLIGVKNKTNYWRIVYGLLGLIVIITFLFNHSLSKKYWYKKSFPADVVWEFIKSKQLNALPNDAILILEQDFYYKSAELYQVLIRDHTGKIIHVLNIDNQVLGNIERIQQNEIQKMRDFITQPTVTSKLRSPKDTLSHQPVFSQQSSNRMADSTSKIFGLFIKTGKEIEIKLCPISTTQLSNGEFQADNQVLSLLKIVNPIFVIPADLD